MLGTITGKDILKNLGPSLFLYVGTPPTVCQQFATSVAELRTKHF